MFKKNNLFIGVLTICLVIFTGCSSVSTMFKKSELSVNTKMTKTVWLQPSNKKNVYVQVRNVSPVNMNIDLGVKSELARKGYNVVTDPAKADYWLQANVLKIDKLDLKGENSAAEAGVVGAVGAGALGEYYTDSTGTAIALGLIGGAAGLALDSMTEDTQYIMVTDLLVTENPNTNAKKEHKTQVYSLANQMNLKLETAIPVLSNELQKTIANIF